VPLLLLSGVSLAFIAPYWPVAAGVLALMSKTSSPTPINDRMITIAQWFGTRGFMTLWQNFAAMSQRTDVRDAFIRNFHRANRWHVVFHEMAVAKGHMSALPTMDAKG
jgi:hypothetical protein